MSMSYRRPLVFRHPQAAQRTPRHGKRRSPGHGASLRHTPCRLASAAAIRTSLIRAPCPEDDEAIERGTPLPEEGSGPKGDYLTGR